MTRVPAILLVLLLTLSTGACDLIGDVLEFGFWVVVILVVLVVGLIWWVARRFRGPRRPPPPPRT